MKSTSVFIHRATDLGYRQFARLGLVGLPYRSYLTSFAFAGVWLCSASSAMISVAATYTVSDPLGYRFCDVDTARRPFFALTLCAKW